MQLTSASADYRDGASVIDIPAGYDPAKLWLLVNGQVWTPQNFAVVGGQIVIAGDDLSNASIQIAQPQAETPDLSDLTAKLNALLAAQHANALQKIPAVIPRQPVVTVAPTDLKSLRGMDCNTGKPISGYDYLSQRIADALLTSKGTQVLLRSRGSNLLPLIDTSMSKGILISWIAAIADALTDKLSGVPDFKLERVQAQPEHAAGMLNLTLFGNWMGNGVEVTV